MIPGGEEVEFLIEALMKKLDDLHLSAYSRVPLSEQDKKSFDYLVSINRDGNDRQTIVYWIRAHFKTTIRQRDSTSSPEIEFPKVASRF